MCIWVVFVYISFFFSIQVLTFGCNSWYFYFVDTSLGRCSPVSHCHAGLKEGQIERDTLNTNIMLVIVISMTPDFMATTTALCSIIFLTSSPVCNESRSALVLAQVRLNAGPPQLNMLKGHWKHDRNYFQIAQQIVFFNAVSAFVLN